MWVVNNSGNDSHTGSVTLKKIPLAATQEEHHHPMDIRDAAAFLRRQKYGVVSSSRADGQPQSAVVGFGWNDKAEGVFDALGDTHKAINLRRDPRASVVVWEGTRTIQLEGLIDEPQGAEREAALRQYFEAHPDGPERLTWPGIAHFRFRPQWIRDSDFGVTPGPLIKLWVAPARPSSG